MFAAAAAAAAARARRPAATLVTHSQPAAPFTFHHAGFCCKLEDNTFKLDFLAFFIKDYDTRRMIFSIDRDTAPPLDFSKIDLRNFDMNTLRQIDYNFDVEVLRLERLTTRCAVVPRCYRSPCVKHPHSRRPLLLMRALQRTHRSRARRCSPLTPARHTRRVPSAA